MAAKGPHREGSRPSLPGVGVWLQTGLLAKQHLGPQGWELLYVYVRRQKIMISAWWLLTLIPAVWFGFTVAAVLAAGKF